MLNKHIVLLLSTSVASIVLLTVMMLNWRCEALPYRPTVVPQSFVMLTLLITIALHIVKIYNYLKS